MNSHNKAPFLSAVAASSILLWSSAYAFDEKNIGLYAEGGRAAGSSKISGTNSATMGVIVRWTPLELLNSGSMSTYLDLFISNWHVTPVVDGGHANFLQIGMIPTLRYRFADGTSPWFLEAGVGVTVMNHLYRTPDRQFSTAFQFTEALGVGRSFGEHGQHEISLRIQHFSNAGIKKPNPGENFFKIRYAYRF